MVNQGSILGGHGSHSLATHPRFTPQWHASASVRCYCIQKLGCGAPMFSANHYRASCTSALLPSFCTTATFLPYKQVQREKLPCARHNTLPFVGGSWLGHPRQCSANVMATAVPKSYNLKAAKSGVQHRKKLQRLQPQGHIHRVVANLPSSHHSSSSCTETPVAIHAGYKLCYEYRCPWLARIVCGRASHHQNDAINWYPAQLSSTMLLLLAMKGTFVCRTFIQSLLFGKPSCFCYH